MSRSLPPCSAQESRPFRRSVRQGQFGRWLSRGTGAASPCPPGGVAPPPASAAAPLPRWSRRLLIACSVVAAALANPLVSPADAQTMEERARTAAQASRDKTSDSDALQQNYVTPGLAGQPISTVDNSRTFSPNIACQKTATMMEVLVQPASTGDLGKVTIARDTDLDGTVDSTSSLPVPVSGLCANGVISCQPGTWNNCSFFRWEVDAAKALKLTAVDLPQLAGCYCLNNSCGTNLAWGNMASVLRDLGGGMIGALTTADPRFGVAQAVIDGPAIRYVGAQSTACAADPALPQTAYRAAPGTLSGDAFAASRSNSVFEALAGSAAGTGRAELVRQCTIEREVTVESWGFDDIVGASGPFQSVRSCGTDCRRYRIQGEGNCSAAPPIFNATFDIHKPERLVSARIVGMGAEDWVQGRVNGAIVGYAGKRPWLTEALPSGDCAVDGSYSNSVVHDVTAELKAGRATIGARVRGGKDERWGYLDVEIRVDTSCATSERLVDLCSPLAADPSCRLDTEEVDDVFTFRNGVNTGLSPLPQTRVFGSAACAVQLSRPFFRRDGRYRCTVDTGTLPAAPDLSRGAYIIDHSTETMLADRTRQSDGTVQTSTRPFALPDRGSVPACEPICKTRAPRVNSGVAPAGVVGEKQNDPASYDSFYHACSADNVCPAGPGEEIVSACGCLDDFPEAVVMMQTVRLAGADLVCTGTVQ